MNFLFFLWNTFARILGTIAIILMEILVFSLIITAIPFLAPLLTPVFVIWIIIDIVLRVFVGGGKSVFNWIFKRY